MSDTLLLVFCTCPDKETAHRLASQLVEQRLAACVNISAPSRSVYRWQDRIEQAEEILLSIKTTAGNYSRLEQNIRQGHPYQVPEIIALPVRQGLPEYLKWVEEECASSDS